MSKKDPCRFVTPVARLSFPAIFQARGFKDQAPKFSATFIFSNKTDLAIVHEAVKAATMKEWGTDKTKWPKKIVSPLHDGNEDKPDVDGYQDSVYITASNKHRPEVVTRQMEAISEESGDLEAGHYVRGALRAYAYTEPKCGITFSLESVMKIKDGPTFSGKEKAEVAFADVVDEEDSEGGNDSDNDDGF